MFKRSEPTVEQPKETVQQFEENEGVRILFDFKLTGETVSKIAIAVISAAVVGLITTVVVQTIKSPIPAETVRPSK